MISGTQFKDYRRQNYGKGDSTKPGDKGRRPPLLLSRAGTLLNRPG
jgi:hypothetical protein